MPPGRVEYAIEKTTSALRSFTVFQSITSQTLCFLMPSTKIQLAERRYHLRLPFEIHRRAIVAGC